MSFRLRSRAQSIVEFALVVPVLMLFLLGILAFGQLYTYKIRLDNAAREGVRRGIVGGTRTGPGSIDEIVRRRANVPGANNSTCTPGTPCLVVAVMPDDGASACTLDGGGTPTYCGAPYSKRAPGCDMVVNVRYDAYVTVPIVGLFVNPKTIYARSVMRIETCPPPP